MKNRKRHIIKKVMKSGNAGSVYVPKDWIDQLVVIRLFSVNGMVLEALSPYLENIQGIYLHGPHARGEDVGGSDMDVFVVTKKEVSPRKTHGMNIETVRRDEIEEYARENPVEFHSMIKEAVPIMNESLLDELREYKLDREGIDKYYRDVERTLSLAKELEKDGDLSGAVYSLILKLKGMYVIGLKGEEYSRDEFEDFMVERGIKRDRFRSLYEVYRAKKGERVPGYEVSVRDVRRLYETAAMMAGEGKFQGVFIPKNHITF
jgi:predicted nucleotidyltransferase